MPTYFFNIRLKILKLIIAISVIAFLYVQHHEISIKVGANPDAVIASTGYSFFYEAG